MPKKYLKKYIPTHEQVKEQKYLKVFGNLLNSPRLFYLNRRSVSGAFFIGFFMCYVPVPFQMFMAAAVAIVVRVNVPISIALVWITNPFTIPIMFYWAYLTGIWVLGVPEQPFQFELSWEWLQHGIAEVWQPFILGCFINAVVLSIVGGVGMRLLWRYLVIRNWQLRKARQLKLNKT